MPTQFDEYVREVEAKALLAPLGARLGIVQRESCDESEIGADGEAEAVTAERVRSGAAQGTGDRITVLAELGIDAC